MNTEFYCYQSGEYIDLSTLPPHELAAKLIYERCRRVISEEELSDWYEWFLASPFRSKWPCRCTPKASLPETVGRVE